MYSVAPISDGPRLFLPLRLKTGKTRGVAARRLSRSSQCLTEVVVRLCPMRLSAMLIDDDEMSVSFTELGPAQLVRRWENCSEKPEGHKFLKYWVFVFKFNLN